MTLIFTVIFSITILHQKISVRVLLCCLCVAAGFVLGVDQEHLKGTLSIRGVGYGIVTSLFVALNGIYIKKSVDIVNKDKVKLTFYNNINAILMFLPFVLLLGQAGNFFATDKSKDTWFWLFLVFTGLMGFGMAWISAVQIDLLSPVSHHIIANSKAVIQTLIGESLFSAIISVRVVVVQDSPPPRGTLRGGGHPRGGVSAQECLARSLIT